MGEEGAYLARSAHPPPIGRGESLDEAAAALQEAALLALEMDYPGRFGGNFTASATFLSFEVTLEDGDSA